MIFKQNSFKYTVLIEFIRKKNFIRIQFNFKFITFLKVKPINFDKSKQFKKS